MSSARDLDAAATDPKANRIMQGFPPEADRTVRFHDGTSWRFPQSRWSFSHQRELGPSAAVRRGAGAASALTYGLRDDLDAVAFTTLDGKTMTWGQSVDVNFTDGLLVMHKGVVVYETYRGALDAQTPHLCMSVTKSFVGLMAAMLVHEGVLDPAAPVSGYVPELAHTAYGDATLRQVLDMTIGVRYSENYTDPDAEVRYYGNGFRVLREE